MKMWVLLVASVVCGTAFAADQCVSDCAETGKECQNTCKKALKKDQADKIGFCQDKCKEFENECKKDCQNSKK